MSRKVVFTKEKIELVYKTRNLDETATILGVSVKTLRRCMAETGVKAHPATWQNKYDIGEGLLRDLYQEHSVPEIAQMLGVNLKTVYARAREYDIDLRRRGPVRVFAPKRGELRDLYCVKKMSMRDISKHYGVGETVVFKRLREHGLSRDNEQRERDRRRTAAVKKSRLSYTGKTWTHAVFKRDGYKCQSCGVKQGVCGHCHQLVLLHAHHIRRVKTHPELQFDLSNGITLCRMCHVAEHKKQIG